MIEINKLTKSYGDRKVLSVDCLKIKKGETVAVIGPNGSGKSTLLKILSGVIESTSGEFSISGKVLYLPQQSIPFKKTVKNNLTFSFKGNGDKEKKAQEILSALELTELSDKNARGLSGGEGQRLALGRVLMNACDFLLLDEPSSAADIEGTEIIERAIRAYKEKTGCGILMTTHSPAQARKLADRIIILYKGEIAEEGTPEELADSPKSLWGKKFIDSWNFSKQR